MENAFEQKPQTFGFISVHYRNLANNQPNQWIGLYSGAQDHVSVLSAHLCTPWRGRSVVWSNSDSDVQTSCAGGLFHHLGHDGTRRNVLENCSAGCDECFKVDFGHFGFVGKQLEDVSGGNVTLWRMGRKIRKNQNSCILCQMISCTMRWICLENTAVGQAWND